MVSVHDKSFPERSHETRPLRVSELNNMLRRSVEAAASNVWVAGEISGFRPSASGHAYFSLKDEKSSESIDAVAYRATASRFRRDLRNGARVLVLGKATVWTQRGKLQLVVNALRPQGRGALLEALERLKATLLAEGLFAPENKRQVPTDARVIGVVTSRTGAVIHDITQVSFRRGNPRIILAPAIVQGDKAVDSLIAGLDLIERLKDLDVIIIGRGGGSFEDLLPFYDERLVRRIAACSVPVVSAVGHEVDVTFTDLVADARAATPSQAAELVVADKRAQREGLAHLRKRLIRAFASYLREGSVAVDRLTRQLGDPRDWINERRQRIDELTQRATTAVRSQLQTQTRDAARLQRMLLTRHPRSVLANQRVALQQRKGRLASAVRESLNTSHANWTRQQTKLRALSPLAVLDRGYALVSDKEGNLLLDASRVNVGDSLGVRLKHGRLLTTVRLVQHDE